MDLRTSILETTLTVFNQKGLKFTMDDVAGAQGISKKTIYTVFHNKEELFLTLVDYLFDGIKAAEAEIVQNDTLSTLQKIHRILGVLPEGYKDIDFRKLYLLKDKYPKIYRKVEQRLETGWEETLQLLQKGMDEGVIRKVHLPLVKMMLEASLEQFFTRDLLLQSDLTYQEALAEVVDILTFGIAAAEAYNNTP